MDVSPVRSSGKCGSDFSIERILSNESGSRPAAETPSWLCCTRYQPPRLPRAANNACRARRSGRHARVPFTAAQAAALEAAYARAPYLAPPALRALAAALQLRDDRMMIMAGQGSLNGGTGSVSAIKIKIWFQNRRARERREKSASIAPPREVPLAPTTILKPQGFPPCSPHTWSQSRTELNISHSIVGALASKENRLQFDDSVTEYPRDLSVASSSYPLNDPRSEVEYERSDTPLDIETIED